MPSVRGARGNISGNVDVNSLASGEYNAGNVTLTGSKLSVGKSIVIKSSGVVRISGDLLYTDTNDVRQLPQLIIYAKNIIIEPSVGEVNAWLITQKDGYVSTCGVVISAGGWLSGVSESSCGKQLKVNGQLKLDTCSCDEHTAENMLHLQRMIQICILELRQKSSI